MSSPAIATALVTGASSGIGRAYARELARRGSAVVLSARRRDALEALAAELEAAHGVRTEVLVADLAVPDDLERVAQRAARPDVDLLVNNAGLLCHGPFVEQDADREREQLEVLVGAVVRLTRAVLPGMVARRRGTLIQVSSRAAFAPTPHLAGYAAAKAYVNRFTLGLAGELEGSPVRLQLCCPGNVRTEIFARAGLDDAVIAGMDMLDPEEVVTASFGALERGRVLCVPGESRRDAWLRGLFGLLPGAGLRRMAGVLERLGT